MKNTVFIRVHFVGIGGIGMSALAQHLAKIGCEVSGSDREENTQTDKLRKLGIKVFVPHNAGNIGNAQLVVRTSAVPLSNVEVHSAIQKGIPVILREELLGEIFDSFSERIAICGTHGKTTVTAMLHYVLERCGVPHAAFIGGEYCGENYFFGQHTVVAEACEYNRSFLRLHPTICLCLNVEYDHPDCYRDIADVECAFEKLFAQSGKVVLCSNRRNLWQNAAFFGSEGITAKKVEQFGGCAHFLLCADGDVVCPVKLSVVGMHNVHNALAVVAVARELGLPLLQVAQALCTFVGVERRWTEHFGSVRCVCDYAHHPTEIAAAVAAAQNVCKGKLICVFQPHTYSRTEAFFSEFVHCFDGADEVVYLPVYSAREKSCGVTSFGLYKAAKSAGKNARYFATFDAAAKHLRRNANSENLVLLIGAGDVDKLADYLR